MHNSNTSKTPKIRKDLFTQDDIELVLKSTNFKKGMGPDLFTAEILDKDTQLRDKFKEECAESLNSGQLPAHQTKGRLVAL